MTQEEMERRIIRLTQSNMLMGITIERIKTIARIDIPNDVYMDSVENTWIETAKMFPDYVFSKDKYGFTIIEKSPHL